MDSRIDWKPKFGEGDTKNLVDLNNINKTHSPTEMNSLSFQSFSSDCFQTLVFL